MLPIIRVVLVMCALSLTVVVVLLLGDRPSTDQVPGVRTLDCVGALNGPEVTNRRDPDNSLAPSEEYAGSSSSDEDADADQVQALAYAACERARAQRLSIALLVAMPTVVLWSVSLLYPGVGSRRRAGITNPRSPGSP